jgi:hypothetical protein
MWVPGEERLATTIVSLRRLFCLLAPDLPTVEESLMTVMKRRRM